MGIRMSVNCKLRQGINFPDLINTTNHFFNQDTIRSSTTEVGFSARVSMRRVSPVGTYLGYGVRRVALSCEMGKRKMMIGV